MSLINDALKKAQRQRAEELVTMPPMGGGRRGDGSKNGIQTIILIGAGAAVLIAVSVVVTVHLLSDRPPISKPLVIPVAAALTSVAPQPVAAQAGVDAVSKPPTVAALPLRPVKPVTTSVEPSPTAETVPTPTPIQPLVENQGPIILTDGLRSDEDIQGMVDKFKVSGVRSGGSKVLMNDHIVRLNEVVDRTTGLRLVKIEDDMLIFKDAKGTLYTKNF